jgi:Fe-S-cluster containining protein
MADSRTIRVAILFRTRIKTRTPCAANDNVVRFSAIGSSLPGKTSESEGRSCVFASAAGNPHVSNRPLPQSLPARAPTLFEELRSVGPLRELLLQAAGEERRAALRLLQRPELRDLTQRLTDDARRRVDRGAERSPLAVLRQCAAGCCSCCWTPVVDVTPLEAIVVAQHLRRSLRADELEQTLERLRKHSIMRQGLSPAERPLARIRCAMLGDDGLCTVYEARPLVCAGVFSLSRQACEQASANTADAAAAVPLDRPAKAWTMGVSGGLQHALVEAGLDGNLYELHGAVVRALERPDTAARWLRGEDAFSGCLCTDPHSPPRRKPNQRIDEPEASRPHLFARQREP